MTIPTNIKQIKEAFTLDQVNQHLTEGWTLIAVVPRGGGMGPLYTLGWTGNDDTERNRKTSSNRARGLA